MNFKPELLEKVLAGTKVQTRRPCKPGEVFTPDLDTWDKGMPIEVYTTKDILRPSGEHWYYRFNRRYVVGKDYAACPGRGKKQLGRIEIVRIRCEDVRGISLTDAKAEGFENEIGFWRVWCGFYDPKFPFNSEKVGRFVDFTDKTVVDVQRELSHRPDSLYQAWALDFKLAK